MASRQRHVRHRIDHDVYSEIGKLLRRQNLLLPNSVMFAEQWNLMALRILELAFSRQRLGKDRSAPAST